MYVPSLISVSVILTTTIAQSSSSLWPGWTQINTIFSFGDSYTTTGFQINSTQPSASNSFGNPASPGRTFSNGRNWIDFLALQYNQSLIMTYNFAVAGAMVDSFGRQSRIPPMTEQVNKFFIPNYAAGLQTGATIGNESAVAKAAWSSSSTLFTTFFGINDVNRFYKSENTSASAATVGSYGQVLEQLYQAGARNFLVHNVPAINRSPSTISQGNSSAQLVEKSRAAVEDFNARVVKMMTGFVEQHSDVTAFLFDNFGLFNQVLDNPKSREETSGYTNTTGFCLSYSRRTYNEDEFNSSCGIPQKEYFWLDRLHPTPPIHNAMAVEITKKLMNNESIGRGIKGSNFSDPEVFTAGTSKMSTSNSTLQWTLCVMVFVMIYSMLEML